MKYHVNILGSNIIKHLLRNQHCENIKIKKNTSSRTCYLCNYILIKFSFVKRQMSHSTSINLCQVFLNFRFILGKKISRKKILIHCHQKRICSTFVGGDGNASVKDWTLTETKAQNKSQGAKNVQLPK